jgi:hypothetical protein
VRCPDEKSGFAAGIARDGWRAIQRAALSASCRVARSRAGEPSAVKSAEHFLGFMDAGRWNRERLMARIQALPPGLTEICCHPRDPQKAAQEPPLNWGYDFAEELEALTSRALRSDLDSEKILVTNFSEYFQTKNTRKRRSTAPVSVS